MSFGPSHTRNTHPSLFSPSPHKMKLISPTVPIIFKPTSPATPPASFTSPSSASSAPPSPSSVPTGRPASSPAPKLNEPVKFPTAKRTTRSSQWMPPCNDAYFKELYRKMDSRPMRALYNPDHFFSGTDHSYPEGHSKMYWYASSGFRLRTYAQVVRNEFPGKHIFGEDKGNYTPLKLVDIYFQRADDSAGGGDQEEEEVEEEEYWVNGHLL